MAKPIAIKEGIAFGFPDVCNTPSPTATIPIPYPNIAQLSDADSTADNLEVGPKLKVLLGGAKIESSSGDEAGVSGGLVSGKTSGKCEIPEPSASQTVLYGSEQKGLVRFLDVTTQNDMNAAGFVLSAFPTVLVGG